MESLKMAEMFPEAFQVEHNKSFEVQDVTWYSYGSKYESDGDQDSAIQHAVLNHDRLVEENAELRANQEELLKAVKFLYSKAENLNELQSKNISSMIEFNNNLLAKHK